MLYVQGENGFYQKEMSSVEENHKLNNLGRRTKWENNHPWEPGGIKVPISRSKSFQNHNNFAIFIFINENDRQCANYLPPTHFCSQTIFCVDLQTALAVSRHLHWDLSCTLNYLNATEL